MEEKEEKLPPVAILRRRRKPKGEGAQPRKQRRVEIEDFWSELQNRPLHVLTCQDPLSPGKVNPDCRERIERCRELIRNAYKIGKKLKEEGVYGLIYELGFKSQSVREQIEKYVLFERMGGGGEFPFVVKVSKPDTIANKDVTNSFFLSILVVAGVSCGFIRTLDWFRCAPELLRDKYPNVTSVQYIIEERADMTLHQYFEEEANRNVESFRSIMFQVFHALLMAQKWYGFYHGDMHFGNIMVVQTNRHYGEQFIPYDSVASTLWLFYTNEKTHFTIPASNSNGYQIKIIDFGGSYLSKMEYLLPSSYHHLKYYSADIDVKQFISGIKFQEYLFKVSRTFELKEDRKNFQDLLDMAVHGGLEERHLLHPFFQVYADVEKQKSLHLYHVQMTQWVERDAVLGEFMKKVTQGEDWQTTPPLPRCTNCGAACEFACTGSCGGATLYCGARCQSEHWEREHSFICSQLGENLNLKK